MKGLESKATATSLGKIEPEKTDGKPAQKAPEHCPVCCEEIEEATRHKLPTCDHSICLSCFPNLSRFSCLCPVCRKPFCVVKGNQPEGATMNFDIEEELHLPGFDECGTIIVYYEIPSGTQTVSIGVLAFFHLSVLASGSGQQLFSEVLDGRFENVQIYRPK